MSCQGHTNWEKGNCPTGHCVPQMDRPPPQPGPLIKISIFSSKMNNFDFLTKLGSQFSTFAVLLDNLEMLTFTHANIIAPESSIH